MQFKAEALNWGSGDFTVTYDECTGKVRAKLLNFYYDDCFACYDDFLDYASFYLWRNGAWVEIAYSSGSNGSCQGGIPSARNGYAITGNFSGSCNSREYINVYLQVPSDILNSNSGVVKIKVTGLADDDNSDTVIDWEKEASIPPISEVQGFTVTTDECSKVILNWNTVTLPACLDNSINREVQIRKDGSYVTYVASGNTYTDNNVQNGAEHDYQVGIRYWYSGGIRKDGPLTTTKTGQSIPDPIDPTNFTATTDNCDGTINLTWDYANGVEAYEIWDEYNLTTLPPLTGNAVSYTFEDVVGNEDHLYEIRAKNICNEYSSYIIVTGSTISAPVQPTGLQVSIGADQESIEIEWLAVPYASSYEVERTLLGGGGSYFFNVTTPSHIDASIVQCQTYDYRVRAINECAADGVVGEEVESIQLVPDLDDTFNDESLVGSKGFYSNRVELSWSVDNNENFLNGYKIFRRVLGSEEDSTVIASLNSGSNIYIDNLVDAGVLYQYYIIGESQCEQATLYTNVDSVVGFRSPFGTITGQVAYAGGIAVENVKITAESTADILGKSLEFDGASSLTIPHEADLEVSTALLLEAWIRPTATANDFTLFEKTGSYQLAYDNTSGEYVFQITHNSGQTSSNAVSNSFITLNNYNHLAVQLYQDSLQVFVNGNLITSSFVTAGTTIDNTTNPIQIGSTYEGLIDELRIWNTGKSEENILKDYVRLMNGGEAGLKVYLRMNEGKGKDAYDISRLGNEYNRNHAVFNGTMMWSDSIPTVSQLGIVAYTDAIGNYIMTLPYNGNGEVFVLSPSYLTHEFDPPSQAIYVGDGSFIHNNINFKDKSSFKVEGTVFYKGTSCPAENIFLKRDGDFVIDDNGDQVVTTADGKFNIQVPIGEHVITVEKPGHGFSIGRFEHNFQSDKPEIDFIDSTLIKVVGRVVGGAREARKIPGLGKSINNVGKAEITFTSQLGNGCSTTNITTVDSSGEYTVYLPPLIYVPTVGIPTNPATSFGVLNVVDLTGTPMLKTEYDSIGSVVIDSIQYHRQLDFPFPVPTPTIVVKDRDGINDFIGETSYEFINPTTEDTTIVDLRVNPFRWPVFKQQDDDFLYRCLIKVYEEYTNSDLSFTNPTRDSVPIVDGKLLFINDLADLPVVEVELEEVNTLDSLKFLIYSFKPGVPNFDTNLSIPDYSFVRKFEINLISSIGVATPWTPVTSNIPMGGDEFFRGYLLGGRSNGNQFITTGPKVPEYVLRDPPGSGSSATREAGSTKSETNSWNWDSGVGANTKDQVFAGAKFSVGIGVSTEVEVEANITTGFSAEISGGNKGSQKVVTTNTSTWSTNDGSDQVGAGSDVYIGKAKNVTLGIAEHLSLVPISDCGQVDCLGPDMGGFRFAIKLGLSMVPGGYETAFILNEAHIKNYTIPDLKQAKKAMLQSNSKYTSLLDITNANYGKNNDDPVFGTLVSSPNPNSGEFEDLSGPSYTYLATSLTDSLVGDSVRWINNQIGKWEEAIWLNEWEKVNIGNTVVIDSLRLKELNELEAEYSQTIDAYYALIVANGLVGAVAAYSIIANPIPGSAVGGYATFAVTTGTGIALAEVTQDYEEYTFKRDRILQKFNQTPINRTISGGNSFTYSISHESASSYTRSMEYNMTTGLSAEIKAKTSNNGIGLEKGIEVKFSSGRDWSEESSSTETVSYTLYDPDQGDIISVDIYPSILGWGPVFKKQAGGRTACPHEPALLTSYYNPGTVVSEATLQRDVPTISSSPSAPLTNIPVDEAAVFSLTLGNSSESGDPRIYNVSLVSTSNPFGALVSVDGSSPNFSVAIPAGASVNKTVAVEKGPGAVYNYDSLKFIITSPCQYQAGTSDNIDIVEEAYISAHFLPKCTDVALASPEDQWILNNSFSNNMPVTIVDYNINFFDLQSLRFEYKPSSDPNWIGLQSFLKDTTGINNVDLPIADGASFTSYDWNVSQLTDGNYDLRVTSQCSLVDEFSVTYSGLMDRINPHPFGNPSPADGILDPNDEISMKFNEPIDLGSLTALNFDIRGVLNGTENNHNTSLYFDGVDDYLEVVSGAPLRARDFTIEFSAKRNGTGEQAILSQGSDLAESMFVGFNDNDQFVFRIGGVEVASSGSYTDNDWHYFAVSYNFDNETAELYVIDGTSNGIVNNGNTTMYPDYIGSGKMEIGKSTITDANYFTGNIHELRIWTTARSATEFSISKSRTLNSNEPGLLFNWRMDEADGIIAEDHVRRRDASIIGSEWQINPSGSAVEFDGTDDYLKVATGNVNITEGMDYTLEFWFNSTQAGEATLFSNGTADADAADSLYSWNIDKDADGKIHVKNYSLDFVAVDDNYFDGEWHHFSLTLRRTGSISAYIDGDLENSMQSQEFKQLGGDHMYLGAKGYYTGAVENIENHFVGKMDEFRFWNASRKFEQVKRDKQNRMNGDELGLKVYLPFENYVLDPTGPAILTPTFDDQVDVTHLVTNPNGVTLIDQTPLIKVQRPIEAVAFNYSVNNDEIIFTVTSANELIENVTLDVTVEGVKDLHGNVMESPKTWISYVDRNQVIWQDDLLEFEKLLGDDLDFTSAILNQGGAATQFEMLNIPSWLTVTPSSGTIAPNSVLEVEFSINPLLNIGGYFEDIQLITDFNYAENLSINLKVRAEEPDWTINPEDFENSMGIIGLLKINDITSSDSEDKLAAFSGNELRGVQYLEYIPQADAYLVFLDVYSNSSEEDSITFKIWDASAGIVYSRITPISLPFEANTLVGSVSSPQVFATDNKVDYDIPLNEGWNWIGHFLHNEDSTDLDITLASIEAQTGDEIKTLGNNILANYDGTNGWRGPLEDIGVSPEKLYKLKVSQEDVLTISGEIIDPSTRTIDLVNNWNWIGFISVRNQSVTEAFGNLSPSEGDLLKGQSQFAVYDPLLGWIGSLKTMVPGRGYMYKSDGIKSFTYPLAGFYREYPGDGESFKNDEWNVDYGSSASNMTVILELDGDCIEQFSNGNFAIGSFDSNGKITGIAPIEKMDNVSMVFLTAMGETDKTLELRLLDLEHFMEYELDTEFLFQSNQHLGEINDPLTVEVSEKVCADVERWTTSDKLLLAYPSPFFDQLTVGYFAELEDKNAQLSLYNTSGQRVFIKDIDLANGYNHFKLSIGNLNMASGIYFLTLRSNDRVETIKVIKEHSNGK